MGRTSSHFQPQELPEPTKSYTRKTWRNRKQINEYVDEYFNNYIMANRTGGGISCYNRQLLDKIFRLYELFDKYD